MREETLFRYSLVGLRAIPRKRPSCCYVDMYRTRYSRGGAMDRPDARNRHGVHRGTRGAGKALNPELPAHMQSY